MLNEIEVTFRVDLISNNCYKEQLSQWDTKEAFVWLFYWKEDLADQINKNNLKKTFEHVF